MQWEVRNLLVCGFELDRLLFYAFFLYFVRSSEYVAVWHGVFSDFDRFEGHNPLNTENLMQACASQASPKFRWGAAA